MRSFSQIAFAVLLAAGFVLPASAIVVANYTVATNAPSNEVSGTWDMDWNNVYNYKTSSGVAVGSHWLLTAAHVANDGFSSTLTINGTPYYQQEIIFHAAADDPNHIQKADLALVRFDKPFPGFYELYTKTMGAYQITQPNKRLDVIMVGFGATGTVSSASFTDSGSAKGKRRWGSNKLDGMWPNPVEVDLDDTANVDLSYSDGFALLFSSTDTDYEAGVGVGDSGGGTFVKDGVWKLAGINTVRFGSYPNYEGTFSISIPRYAAWINAVIAAADGDDDLDGIPNWWEEQYSTNVLADTDQDGDGMTGEQEYIADTDPTDSNSFWQVEGAITSADQTFTFEGSTARQYQLLYTTNSLTDPGSWITNGTPIWGEGANTEIAVTNTEELVFYRMQAILP